MNKQRQIEEYIVSLLENNVLSEGERLFSIREMAKMQGTSITPVLAAYQSLEMKGIIESRPRSGFFIAGGHETRLERSASEYVRLFDVDTDKQASMRSVISELVHNPNIKYPFAPTQMPPHLTNREKLSVYLKQSICQYSDQDDRLFYRHDTNALTTRISEWMRRYKCIVDPADIRITSGPAQSVLLALQACLGRGGSVAIESPGNSSFFFAAKLCGASVVQIKSDPDTGMDIGCFEEAVRHNESIRCVICAPNFSNPTGALMPVPNQQRLLAFCKKRDIIIIEDDSAGDFSNDIFHPLPIRSMDSENVIYVSGFENSMIHLSYVTGERFQRRIQAFAEIEQAWVSPILQLGFAMYLQSPHAKKHLQFVQEQYKKSVREVRGAVLASFPEGTRASAPLGGRFIWVELPEGVSSIELLSAVSEYSISFSPGPVFSYDASYTNCLRLNCAAAALKPEMLEGIYILGEKAKILAQSH